MQNVAAPCPHSPELIAPPPTPHTHIPYGGSPPPLLVQRLTRCWGHQQVVEASLLRSSHAVCRQQSGRALAPCQPCNNSSSSNRSSSQAACCQQSETELGPCHPGSSSSTSTSGSQADGKEITHHPTMTNKPIHASTVTPLPPNTHVCTHCTPPHPRLHTCTPRSPPVMSTLSRSMGVAYWRVFVEGQMSKQRQPTHKW
jgi:hypothetical protein